MATRSCAFTGSIYSAHKKCDCGGHYERDYVHPQHNILFPYCVECGEWPERLMLQRRIKKKLHDIYCDRNGSPIKNAEDAIALSKQIDREIAHDVFDPGNYCNARRNAEGTIAETLESFINRVVLKQFPEKEENPDYIYLREHIAAHMGEVGVFALGEIHYHLYVKNMRIIKQPDRDRVKRLFNLIMDLARPQIAA